jgi:hypothetical protein
MGTMLLGVKIEGAIWVEAIYDSKTTWPDSFDPVAAGAWLVDKLWQTDAESPA